MSFHKSSRSNFYQITDIFLCLNLNIKIISKTNTHVFNVVLKMFEDNAYKTVVLKVSFAVDDNLNIVYKLHLSMKEHVYK